MEEQHSESLGQVNNHNFIPKEGQRDLLCCNKESHRCPSLGFGKFTSEDDALMCLASILVEAFLDHKKNEQQLKQQKGNHILSSID